MAILKNRKKIAPRRIIGAQSIVRRNSTVSRWGNSLGLRIPREAAEKLNLKAGQQVRVELHADSMTVKPTHQRKKWSENELLKGVTPGIVGGEINSGRPAGKEVW